MDGLWDDPISTSTPHYSPPLISPKQHLLNVIITKDKTKKELVNDLHACCFSPTKRTFLQVIKNGIF